MECSKPGAERSGLADKVDFLVTVLQALDPDVIALQEILDQAALLTLATRVSYQPFAAAPDSRGNRVAFLTRRACGRSSADHSVSTAGGCRRE
jgi:hypothetical protein